jgi:hypothetical protein
VTYLQLRNRVERTLGDYKNLDYTPTIIGDYINDGYIEFANLTHSLVKHYGLVASLNTSLYTLPDDLITIKRAEWNGINIPIYTSAKMDATYGADWRATDGETILTVIQDSEGYGTLRIYPYLDDQDYIGNTVAGTDSKVYYCSANHTSASATKPTTGINYASYWTVLTSAWVTATEYDCGDWVLGETDSKAYQCIKNHKSSSDDTPITGTSYATYWANRVTAGTWATATEYYEWLRLNLDYSYIPRELSADGDEPAIPSKYHMALAEYAMAQCQEEEQGFKKDIRSTSFHYNKFMRYVHMCRRETYRGFINNKQPMIRSRNFI